MEEIKVSWEGDEEMDIYEEIKKIKEENAALRAKVEELTGRNAADEKRIAEVIKDIMSCKDEPESKENRENCVMINFLANQMQDEKPYYSILYYDKRDDCYYEGFGSYNYQIVNAYKEAYFEHWDRDYFVKQIEELTDKHWEECRQIALYDDELREAQGKCERQCGLKSAVRGKI